MRIPRGVAETVLKRAVVLLSGGLDSATTVAIAKAEGYEIHAISFDYGQRHARELESARAVAKSLGAAGHLIVEFDMRRIGGSALTDEIDVPLDRETDEMAEGIPATYVPARNTIFLSFALGYAEALGAFDIFIGVSQVDYSGYPDCRAEFVESFEKTANLATKAGVEGKGRFRIHYSLTWSCYMGEKKACGRCDSCKLRLAGFAAAGAVDPLEYA
jgi:7-cyano-7-deazaguanine synthase